MFHFRAGAASRRQPLERGPSERDAGVVAGKKGGQAGTRLAVHVSDALSSWFRPLPHNLDQAKLSAAGGREGEQAGKVPASHEGGHASRKTL